jgi:hypothetical protein
VIAVGMTEPDAGSATTDLKTTATPDGKGFRINGSKVFPNPHAQTSTSCMCDTVPVWKVSAQ